MTLTATLRPGTLALLMASACAPSIARGTARSTPTDCGVTVSCDESPTPEPTVVDPPTSPSATVALRPPEQRRPEPQSGPYRARLVGEGNRDLPRFSHDGRSYVLGERGARYSVVISNPTARRVEAVISIDGLDAVDGQPADYVRKPGYILPPYGSATIEGFRTSLDRVATFRFSSVADSYAGRLGQARDVGVIGVAFFPERPPVVVARPRPPAPKLRHVPSEQAPASAPASERADPLSDTAGDQGANAVTSKRPGLGTEFGEGRDSHVEEVAFERASPSTPAQIATVRYNDRAGLEALGIRVDPPDVPQTEVRTRETADPFRTNRFAAPPP